MSVATSAPANSQSATQESVALASRMDRLIAALIDTGVMLVAVVPTVLVLNLIGLGLPVFFMQIVSMMAAVSIFLALNYRLLRDEGQTIGKRIMNLRIVGNQNERMDVNELLLKRYAPVWAICMVPFIGGLLAIANVCCIFRDSRACGHDEIAGTRVIAD